MIAAALAAALLAACGSSGGSAQTGTAAANAGSGSSSTASSSSGGSSSSRDTFKLGVIADADEFTPQLVAAAQNLFKKNGVNVSVQEVAPSALHSALQSGSVDGLSITADPSVLRIVDHLPYVVVGQAMQNETFSLLAAPGINSLKDLEGKTIAAPAVGQVPAAVLQNLLDKAGVNAHIDHVELTSSAGALFTAGRVDAIFEAGNVVAKAQASRSGSKVIVPAAQAAPMFPPAGLTVTQSYLAKNRDKVTKVMTALIEASRLVRKDPSAATSVWQKEFGLSAEQAKNLYPIDKEAFATSAVPTPAEFNYIATLDSATAEPKRTFTGDQIKDTWDLGVAQAATQAADKAGS